MGDPHPLLGCSEKDSDYCINNGFGFFSDTDSSLSDFTTMATVIISGPISTQFSSPSIIISSKSKSNPRKTLAQIQFLNPHSSSSTFFSTPQFTSKFKVNRSHFSPKASSSSYPVGSSEYIVEPTTDVKFKQTLNLPGCSNSVVLFGTGYREKVFAIIGVKVYAAGFYATQSLIETLYAWKGRSAAEIQGNSSLYDSIFQAPIEKSLHIILVRDIDGKTFWDALNEAISPRIKTSTPDDESALSQFRSTFQGRSLKKGTHIFLTWLEPSKMLVCISSDGLPSTIDATIKSMNVTRALFDVFFGDKPVSPSLKASVSDGLSMILRK